MKKFLTFIIILLVSGCQYNYLLEVPETRTWSAANINQIKVKTENGRIDVSASPDTIVSAIINRRCRGEDKADAEKYINNIIVKDTIVANQLTLTAEIPNLSTRSYGCDISVAAKESIYLDLNTSDGQVAVAGMKKGGVVSTSNGVLNFSNTSGRMAVRTSNCQITVQAHSRTIKANTSNSKIECDITGLPINDTCELHTSNSKVILSLPSDVAASFEASTSNSEVTVTGFATVNYSRNERTNKTGTIGNVGSGKAVIKITTSNSDVTIQAR